LQHVDSNFFIEERPIFRAGVDTVADVVFRGHW